jgi:hypothetical protein
LTAGSEKYILGYRVVAYKAGKDENVQFPGGDYADSQI